MTIKERIFEFIRKRRPQRQAVFPHYDQVKRVLILFESDILEKNAPIKAIRQQLLAEGIDAVLWGYVDKKEIQSAILPQSRILGQKDFHWWGTPQQEIIDSLQQEHYDLLFDLTTTPSLPLRYLALYADSAFKVGLHQGEGVHDLLISMPAPENEDPTPLFQQMHHFIQQIRSND